jgi:hypothetical protein
MANQIKANLARLLFSTKTINSYNLHLAAMKVYQDLWLEPKPGGPLLVVQIFIDSDRG